MDAMSQCERSAVSRAQAGEGSRLRPYHVRKILFITGRRRAPPGKGTGMPELSRFYGIVVRMYFDDDQQHSSPHIHVYYGSMDASYSLQGKLLGGKIPPKQEKLLLAWIALHEQELQEKAIQYQSINQSFRMVGSINDKHGTELVAFRTGERVTLDYLNAYAKPENRVDVNKPFSPSKMTRAEAREAYPEWYERVVVRGEKGRKKWDIAGKVHGDDPYALYHWWLRQIGEIKGGHRYFFLMCLAIYAYKCGVSKQQLRQDMKEAFDDLQMVKHENALTEEDIRSALEAYDKEYYNFTISDIEALTDVRIERNKRNGRSQKEHLKRARAVQEVDYPGGTWRRKGAEEKKAQVYAWRQEHPEGRKADCHRDTGLDPKTIRKWWDTVPEGHITVKIRPSQALSDLLVEEFKKGL